MRIEIDTHNDSKEELMHLGNMLRALAGSKEGSRVEVGSFDKPADIFGDSAPSGGGLFGMFGDSTQQSSAQSSGQPAPSQSASASAGAGDVFSLFSSPESNPEQSVPQPAFGRKTTAADILDDDRIKPY